MTNALLDIAGEEEITAESLVDDLFNSRQLIEFGFEEEPSDLVDRLLRDMDQDPRAPSVELMETGYVPHRLQNLIHEEMMKYRFTVLVCHRRFGKTVLGVNALGDATLRCTRPNPRFVYIAPYLKQAKQIAWMYLKAFAGRVPGSRKNESELYVEFPNCGRVTLYGGDNAEAMRGIYIDGMVMDEPADIKGSIWGEIIRPAMSDRKGWGLFIGTPKGINSFHDMYFRAVKDVNWCALIFRVDETNLPWLDDAEIELLKTELTDSQWRQEYLCDWNASVDNVIVTIDLVSEAMARVVPHEGHLEGLPKVLSLDVARFGGDKSCIAKRWGHFFYPLQVYDQHREDNDYGNMELVGHLSREARDFEPDIIFIDGGRGEGVIDRMRQLGFEDKVIEVNFGARAINPHFKDRRTEMFFGVKEWLEAGGVLPDDHDLKTELSAPTYKFNANNQAVMEPKDVTKETIGRSPDRADAVALSFAAPVVPASIRKVAREVKVSSGGYHPHQRRKRGR